MCAGELIRGVHDVHDGGGLGAVGPAEGAVAEPEVQRGAHHHDQVRLAERGRPGPGDQQFVAGRQDAAALPVGDHRQPEFLGRGPGGLLGAARPDIGAEHQHRALGRGQQAGDPLPMAAGSPDPGPAGAVSGAVSPASGPAGPNRASSAMSTKTGPRCGVAASRNASATPAPIFAVSCSVQARLVIGPEQLRVVELLQAAGAPAVVRGTAAQDHHR